MIDARLKHQYDRACQHASYSILRHPQLSMQDQLHQLAESVRPTDERDVYGRGGLVEQFEQQVATLLGKDAALLLPTGTLAQPLALKLHAQATGKNTVALHPTSHLLLHEHMGIEALWQLNTVTVGTPRRVLTCDGLHQQNPAELAALLLELPMREIGGDLPQWDELTAQTNWARSHGIRCHLDGARLWQATTYYQRSLSQISALFDSVYVSFYKDLGGISGAVLAADEEFIEDARIWARRAGGNPISLYPEVLAARKGLEQHLPVIDDAVTYAVRLGAMINDIDGISVTPNPPKAAMFHLIFAAPPQRLAQTITDYTRETGVVVLPLPRSGDQQHSVCEIAIGRNAMSQPHDFWLRHVKAFMKALNR